MGSIEDALRETFAARVASPPTVDDAAGQAIRRARTVRRRRNSIGATALGLAVTVAAGGAVAAHQLSSGISGSVAPAVVPSAASASLLAGPAPTASSVPLFSVPPGATLPTDVLVGTQLRTTEGRVITLTMPQPPVSAYHVPDGWLALTRDSGAPGTSLWHVSADGAVNRVVDADAVAVAPDGARVAWSSGGMVTVATRKAQKLLNFQRTGNTGSLHPVAFAAGGIMLAGSPSSGGTDLHDIWFPARGNFTKGPNNPFVIFGVSADGSYLYGLSSRGKEPCLAKIDPNGMKVVRTVCGLPLTRNDHMSPSPDGHWLLFTSGSQGTLVDLTVTFNGADQTSDVVQFDLGGPVDGSVAWTDAATAVVGGPGRIVVIKVAGAPQVKDVPVAGAASGQPVIVVPRLGG